MMTLATDLAKVLTALGLTLAMAACAADLAPGSGANTNVQYAWLQAGPNGVYSARAITKAATCPALVIDGTPIPMRPRALPEADFADLVCEGDVASGARALSVDTIALPAPKPISQRIVIIGDTGCRMKASVIQNCNDPNDWPLAKIASAIAGEAPDAILHVGDYFYREIPCPADRPGCAGSPYGDNKAAWDADWFKPAAPIFSKSLLLLARGNHELCTRGGKGWMRYLSPGPYQAECRKVEPSFLVSLGQAMGPDIAMIDSSDAEDIKIIPGKLDMLVASVGEIAPKLTRPTWFLTHKPIRGIYDVDEGAMTNVDAEKVRKETPNGVVSNYTWAEALKKTGTPAQMELALGGHIHSFQANGFGPDYPGQIMMGVSGADLQEKPLRLIPGKNVAGAKLAQAFGITRYGYLLFDRQTDKAGPQWAGSLKAPDGAIIAACTIKGREPKCQARAG